MRDTVLCRTSSILTGQDAACAAENSVAHVGLEKREDALKFKLTLPSLTVGTVGGGTRLKMQNKNLELLGCSEGKHSGVFSFRAT